MEIWLFLVFKHIVLIHPSVSLRSGVVKSEMLYWESERYERHSSAAEYDAMQNLSEL